MLDGAFLHCAKACLKAELWKTESWPQKESLPVVAKVLADHVNSSDYTSEQIEAVLKESYKKGCIE